MTCVKKRVKLTINIYKLYKMLLFKYFAKDGLPDPNYDGPLSSHVDLPSEQSVGQLKGIRGFTEYLYIC